MEDIQARIEREVARWEGVTTHADDGGVSVRLARHELGRIGDGVATFRFREPVRDMLVETGRAEPHDATGVSLPLRNAADADEAIELFRLGYERARVAARVRPL